MFIINIRKNGWSGDGFSISAYCADVHKVMRDHFGTILTINRSSHLCQPNTMVGSLLLSSLLVLQTILPLAPHVPIS